ncbi:MAG: hypothetical protein ABSH41_31035, partial [Syntrophobacteraceae bacterium]
TKITPIGYKQHVKAADATLVIAGGRKISESAHSLIDYATKLKRPCIVSHLEGVYRDHDPISRIAGWVKMHKFKSLNCAVNRDIWYRSRKESSDPWDSVIFLMLNVIDALDGFCKLTQVGWINRSQYQKKASTGRLYRHGDLLIRQIRRLPAGLRVLPSMVLAMGEETGHGHELHPVNGAMLQVYDNRMGLKYFKTDQALLTHQEHDTLLIDKGFYSVKREHEYDNFKNLIIITED